MAAVTLDGIDALRELIGREVGPTDWREITQAEIDAFADLADDHQWIHTDPERAARESPYGTTVAHGNLTLSMIDGMRSQLIEQRGVVMGINYGWNKVRFPAPVPAGGRIRATAEVVSVDELGYIALRELIFGTHVHVGVEGADKAIYVADGIRLVLPLLLALSANSPFWRGWTTGLASARTPVFRAFPRCGIPPHYGDWSNYCERVELMMRAGAIEDYTYLWWDVRPHPNLGTVETRIFDQQTELDHTIALAALTVSLAHAFSAQFDEGAPSIDYPTELIDDNKVRAALRGMEGELVDFLHGKRVQVPAMARVLLDELHDHAVELGCDRELEGIGEICRSGTGSRHQVEIWEKEHDLVELMRRIVAAARV